MRQVVIGLVLLMGAMIGGWMLLSSEEDGAGDVAAISFLPSTDQLDLSGFARAIEPYEWQFPADHGPHLDFQTEWWYYTGNLATEEGRRFGYQFTIFRHALTPDDEPASESEWRSNQAYMAHFTITDVADDTFHQHQRFSRGGAGLAGASTAPRYRVWLDDWEVGALNDAATRTQIVTAAESVALDLSLEQLKPPALQGDRGLSPKSGEPGNASYYYSLSRLATTGTITINGQTFTVSGTSWMDHEFSTSALGADAQGWDWFGLHMDDGRDLMLGQIRLIDGGKEPAFGGLLISADGSTRYLPSDDFTIEAIDTWTSPHTGAVYPAGWSIQVVIGDETLEITLTPLIADQELIEGEIVYWEGAVQVTGDATGYGYAELTGYRDVMTGRF